MRAVPIVLNGLPVGSFQLNDKVVVQLEEAIKAKTKDPDCLPFELAAAFKTDPDVDPNKYEFIEVQLHFFDDPQNPKKVTNHGT